MHKSTLIDIETQVETYETTESSEKKQSNAQAIRLNAKLPDGVKSHLKKDFGAHWNDEEKSFTIPSNTRDFVDSFLEKAGIEFHLDPVYDHYHDLSESEKKASRLEDFERFSTIETIKKIASFTKLLEDFNSIHGTSFKMDDLQNNSQQLQQFESSCTNRQTESLNFLREQLSKLDQQTKNVRSIEKKIDRCSQGEHDLKILDCLHRNEVGDAEAFVDLFREKYVFEPTEGKNGAFYRWNGVNWQLDIDKVRYTDFEEIASRYEKASNDDRNEKDCREALEKRANQLRTDRRRRAVLETVSSKLSLKKQWDYAPMMLPCLNGVINLESGDFRESNPKDYFRKVCPVFYDPKALCPRFDQFIKEITLDNNDLGKFLKTLLGYTILGVPRDEKVFYFYGPGRNGKGTLMQTLQRILGPFAKTFSSEMLLLQRNPPSSSSPNPAKADLQGVRLAVFSEINEGRRIDSAEVKNLSGRDIISARRLFSNYDLQIVPSHSMILQTNYKPKAPADDIALWDRNILIPFDARFVESPKEANERPLDENLKETLLLESSGILNWLVQGAKDYLDKGLDIPKIILDQTKSYRQENDAIGQFIELHCDIQPELSCPAGKFRESVRAYSEEEGLKKPSPREITAYMEKKFNKVSLNKGDKWCGLAIKN